MDAYAAALASDPRPSTAGELGLCEEALGRNVDAHDHLLEALSGEVPSAPPPAPAMWRRYHGAAERVNRRVARVLLLVSPSTAEVLVDGRSLGSHVSGRAFAVVPGRHTWVARLPGFPDATVTHTVRGGDFPDIALLIPGWPPPHPASPPPGVTGGPAPAARAASKVPVPAVGGASSGLHGRGEAIRGEGQVPGEGLFGETCSLRGACAGNRTEVALVLTGGSLVSLGLTPDVGAGFFVGGEARFLRREGWGLSVGAEVRAILPSRGGVRVRDGQPLDIGLIAVAIAPCVRHGRVMGCVVVDPGGTVASGPGSLTFEAGDPTLFTVGMGPRVALDFPLLWREGLRVFADLRFSLLRSGLGYSIDHAPTWTQPRVSGFLGAGVSFE